MSLSMSRTLALIARSLRSVDVRVGRHVGNPWVEAGPPPLRLSTGDLLSLTVHSFPTLPFLSIATGAAPGSAHAYRAPWNVADACTGVLASGEVATGLCGQRVLVLDPPFVYAVDANGQQIDAFCEPGGRGKANIARPYLGGGTESPQGPDK